jgi:hypothetical protein
MNKEQHSERKKNVEARNKAILQEYNRLYNQERLRHDDCIKKLSETYFLSEKTIYRILAK